MLRIFCICFLLSSYRGPLEHNYPEVSWINLNFCIFESFSKFRKSNQIFGVGPLKKRPQSVMPTFYAICCPGYPLSCCIVLVPHFDSKRGLLNCNCVFYTGTFEIYCKFIHSFDDTFFQLFSLDNALFPQKQAQKMPLHGRAEHVREQVTLEVLSWTRKNFRNKFLIRSHWTSGWKIASGGKNSTRFLRGEIFCWKHSALPFRSLPGLGFVSSLSKSISLL